MDAGFVEELSREIIRALQEKGLVPAHEPIAADTPLLTSGLIDSFGLVEVLEVLESVSRVRIPPGRVSPQDLDSVASMIRVVGKWGRQST